MTTCWPASATARLPGHGALLKMSALREGRRSHPPASALRDGVPRTRAHGDAQPHRAGAGAAPGRAGYKIRYIVQGAIDPPTLTLFTNGRLPAYLGTSSGA